MIDRIDADLRGQLLPIRDQHRRPTCLAHAASTAHEHARGLTEPLSEEYLYHFAKAALNAGCEFPKVAQTLANEGQPVERDCPSHASAPALSWAPPTGVAVYKRASISKPASLDAVRTVIAGGRPPVIGIQLPDSFFTPRQPFVLDGQGPLRGYHAVVAVGYGQHGGVDVLLIRNSWGGSWADGGYAWLTEDFLQVHLKEVLVLTGDLT